MYAPGTQPTPPQHQCLERIKTDLQNRSKFSILVTGPPDSGKSSIFTFLRKHLPDNTYFVTVKGTSTSRSHPYRPWLRATNQIRTLSLWSVTKSTTRTFAVPFPSMPGVVGYIADQVVNRSRYKKASKIPFLNNTQQNILFDLEDYLGSAENPIIFLDDLHYWDEDSLNLLLAMGEDDVQAAFPFLSETTFISTYTDDPIDQVPHGETLTRARQSFECQISMYYPDLEQFIDGLSRMGLKHLPSSSTIHALYGICASSLTLTSTIVEHLNSQNDLPDLTATSASRQDDLLKTVLHQKIARLQIDERSVYHVLSAASTIGRFFTINDLCCLLNKDEREIWEHINYAMELSIVRADGPDIEFVNQFLLNVFSEFHNKEFHDGFAKCLRLFGSDDYALRANHLYEAERYETAIQLFIMEILKRLRLGYPTDQSLYHSWKDLIRRYHLLEFLEFMVDRYTEFYQGLHAVCARNLQLTEFAIPERLAIERDYLLAKCATILPDPVLRVAALEKLDSSLEDSTEDLSIWYRNVCVYIALCAVNRQYDQARYYYNWALRKLQKDWTPNYTTQVFINTLRLRVGSFATPEYSIRELEKARRFFGSSIENGGQPHDPLRYYISGCNLAASYLLAGFPEEGYAIAEECERRPYEDASRRYPRLGTALNNYILTGFFAGRISEAQAAETLRTFENNSRDVEEETLILNNLNVFFALVGRLSDAYADLNRLVKRLRPLETVDAYDAYFLAANVASCLLVNSAHEEALKMLNEANPCLQQLNDNIRPYLRRRHEILCGIARERWVFSDPMELFYHPNLTASNEIGPGWLFYGKGFLFTDIEFWSEG